MSDLINTITQLFKENLPFASGLTSFFIGFLFLAISTISFRIRALSNKKAWDGKTRPFLTFGLIFFIIGLILIFIGYPR